MAHPDVDAIFRLVHGGEVEFQPRPSVYLDKEYYCPFNSQNTFWNKAAFMGMYLPADVSFRFTDILRGYIAQRLMWVDELHLGFLGSMVYQLRNQHDLMKDFEDEIPCYLRIEEVVDALRHTEMGSKQCDNMRNMYDSLHRAGIVTEQECENVAAWVADLDLAMAKGARYG